MHAWVVMRNHVHLLWTPRDECADAWLTRLKRRFVETLPDWPASGGGQFWQRGGGYDRIVWSQDLYLRRMGDQMAAHRSAHDYKPTAMKQAEALGAHPRRAPWQLPEPAGPVCGLPPRSGEAGATSAGGTLRGGVAAGSGGAAAVEGELPHTHRRRRSGR